MVSLRISNRKGFTYIVAIGMLGLLAFMGLFLIQSSSTEYSQTAISVYKTMGRQLAEAAAEEAASIIEERLKDKDSSESKDYFDRLLKQCATSAPPRLGGESGKKVSLLDAFPDLKGAIEQTNTLLDIHVSRAGFSIDKVSVGIVDIRPIPQGPLDLDYCYTNDVGKSSYYTPTDRYKKSEKQFLTYDNNFSKDWYGTLEVDVTVSLQKQHKISVNYKLSKDIKLVNVGPIARNYTFYSILGAYISNYSDQASIISGMNNTMNANGGIAERGRLILYNVPFQSRIFMHGPVILRLENPTWEGINEGAYNSPAGQKGPGPSMAYQYSDTFYGFSYFPLQYRALFPNSRSLKQIWGSVPTKGDGVDITTSYQSFSKSETASNEDGKSGMYPEQDTGFWSRVGNLFSDGWKDTYYVGRNIHQMFLPAGPYCRFPWRYVAKEAKSRSVYAPNQKDPPKIEFPDPDPDIRIEHRWKPNDPDTEEKTKILAEVSEIKYRTVTGGIDKKQIYTEFTLNYYNNEEIDGFFSKIWASVTSIGSTVFNVGTLGIQAMFDGIQSLVGYFFKGSSSTQEVNEETEFNNLFPTNYKHNFMGVVTRRYNDENEIPKDKQGRWILNGIYWLNSLTIEDDIVYIGTGTIIVCRNTPMTIKGSVVAYHENGIPQGHLTIFYHPNDNNLARDLATGDAYKRMITLDSNKGKGIVIQASIYSLCGIRSKTGQNITLTDSPNASSFGADPGKPLANWTKDSQGKGLKLFEYIVNDQNCNVILGNYVNFYTVLQNQYGSDINNDLWVIHDYNSPLYFNKDNNGNVTMVQEELDTDDSNGTKRFAYEKMCHDFFMSPKIQHIGIEGSL